MKIGTYEVHSIETGRFALDGGAMFGIVPWVFWSKTNPPDERGRITLAARCLLVRGNGKVILIDDGNGSKFTDKLKDIYRLDNSQSDLLSSLARHGFAAKDVTDVILTHLHFDHAGGSTIMENGTLVPTFPRAKYYVQKAHWDLSQKPSEKDRGSFMKADYEPLMEHKVLEFVEGETQLFPGIDLVVCNGHTSAQQLPRIFDGKTSLLFCCDLFPTVSHLPIPYVMAYDVRPLTTIEEKKKVLARAYEEHWKLFLEHDPEVEAITVKASEKGFVIDQRVKIE
jgi:glyoxylase-like metal-dependent hydrolase (beta-lactamase superfamily II)